MQINIVASAGEAAEAMGDHARSVRWTRFSQAAAGRQGLQSDTTELALLNQLINRLKSAMGPDAFEEAGRQAEVLDTAAALAEVEAWLAEQSRREQAAEQNPATSFGSS